MLSGGSSTGLAAVLRAVDFATAAFGAAGSAAAIFFDVAFAVVAFVLDVLDIVAFVVLVFVAVGLAGVLSTGAVVDMDLDDLAALGVFALVDAALCDGCRIGKKNFCGPAVPCGRSRCGLSHRRQIGVAIGGVVRTPLHSLWWDVKCRRG